MRVITTRQAVREVKFFTHKPATAEIVKKRFDTDLHRVQGSGIVEISKRRKE